jgi:hypothetical protein
MLLQKLGLGSPPRGVPGNPPPPGGPTGPLRRPGDLPHEEIRAAPQKRQLTNEQFDDIFKRLPADPRKRAEALAELGTRIGDEARKHKVVTALRDVISKIQPFMSKKDAKKKLDEALDELSSKGIKKGVMALLEAAFGEAPERPVDGTVTRKEPGEHIVDGPELDSPLDKPKPVQRFAFRFEDMPSRVPPSKYFKIKLRVPTDFKPDDKKYGATRVVCQSLTDYTTSHGRPPFVIDKRIADRGDKQGLQSMDLQAPDEPGDYVLFIYRIAAEPQPVANFTVGK